MDALPLYPRHRAGRLLTGCPLATVENLFPVKKRTKVHNERTAGSQGGAIKCPHMKLFVVQRRLFGR
jgi:hypothetical protein